ncbi:MAG: ATP-dependent RNA helicase DbpA [Candidatus Erwinia impunctatus]
MTAFTALPQLPHSQIANLQALGFSSMTPVQAATLPLILQGKDLCVQAKTGSGKTLAFGLGIMQKITVEAAHTQALVLCPTRELADQVSKFLRQLARFAANIKIVTLCGGQPVAAQRDSLLQPPHIIVGTPGRIRDHLERGTLHVGQCHTLVLDEADRMLEMGFRDEIDLIIRKFPGKRQNLSFSATWPAGMAQITAHLLPEAEHITVNDVSELPAIKQTFYDVAAQDKAQLLMKIISDKQPTAVMVFCNTRRECDQLCQELISRQMDALALHGDLEQRERDQVLICFAQGSCRILVATDVAARGLDINSVDLVINYQLAFDPEVHIHRIGRTARAGTQGEAVSLVSQDEVPRALALEEMQQKNLEWCDSTSWRQVQIKPLPATKSTLQIEGGRKAKTRPGDILGALTQDAGLLATDIGKIESGATCSWVAIERDSTRALRGMRQLKIKGKNCRIQLISR